MLTECAEVEDLLAIVHCFSSRLYGLRNYKKALKKERLSLSERTFRCEACGHEEDRDVNAAKNLEAYPRLVGKPPVERERAKAPRRSRNQSSEHLCSLSE